MRLVLGSLSAVLAVATGASAGPAPVCRLVTDRPNDTENDFNPAGLEQFDDPGADIVSADVASNAGYLTVAIRPRSIAATETTERYLQFVFSVGGRYFRFEHTRRPLDVNTPLLSRERFRAVVVDAGADPETGPALPLDGATGVEDTGRGEVRMSLPMYVVARHASTRAGTPATDFRVIGNQGVGNGLFAYYVDVARSSRVYRLGQPSCVPVGR